MIYRRLIFIFVGLLTLNITSCYSLDGIVLDPNVKSVSIATFPNVAPLQNPTLSQEFTLELQDLFDQRTTLNLTTEGGDLEIEGEITGYRQQATTVISGDQAAQNRLTISVRVRFQNNIKEERSFDRTFSDFADFDANQTLQDAEPTIVPEINERLTQQIFNAITQNW